MEVELGLDEVEKILRVVSDQGSQGVGILAISRKTRICFTGVQSFFSKHAELFEKVRGSQHIRLSPRGAYGGDPDFILQSLKREINRRWLFHGAVVLLSFLPIVIALARGHA